MITSCEAFLELKRTPETWGNTTLEQGCVIRRWFLVDWTNLVSEKNKNIQCIKMDWLKGEWISVSERLSWFCYSVATRELESCSTVSATLKTYNYTMTKDPHGCIGSKNNTHTISNDLVFVCLSILVLKCHEVQVNTNLSFLSRIQKHKESNEGSLVSAKIDSTDFKTTFKSGWWLYFG